MPELKGRCGFIQGITNTGGKNFKTVYDKNGKASQKAIGTVTIFTGEGKHLFDQKKKEGQLELVHYSEMSPAEQSIIRNLENAKHLSFPLLRFRTVNINKEMPNMIAGTDNMVPNEDIGATNVFLYLGWSHELGKIKRIERAGMKRGRKIDLSRKEATLRLNHKNTLFTTR